MAINRVTITGNLTRDPELRATQSGTAVVTMGIAVNDRRKNPQTGEWEDVPNFFDVTMFGTRAEALTRYLSKGSKVAIEGKLRWRQWEKDGEKRSKVEIVADEVEFMSSREARDSAPKQRMDYDQAAKEFGFDGSKSVPDPETIFDDIPFARIPMERILARREAHTDCHTFRAPSWLL